MGLFLVLMAPELRAETIGGRLSLDTYLGGEGQILTPNSLFNPGNQVYQDANEVGFTYLRLDAELDLWDKKVSLVLRPRGDGFLQTPPAMTPEPAVPGPTTRADYFLNEGFVRLHPLDSAELVVGRQNYQWGPAESLNLSNLLRPELLFGLEPFYEVRGKNMARLNLSFGGDVSWVTMVELGPLDDAHFETRPVSPELNEDRVETKLEYAWNHSANQIGIVAGNRRVYSDVPSVGGYLTWTVSDAWQLYGETRVDRGLDLSYPVDGGGFTDPTQDQVVRMMGLVGLRYTTEGATEFRLEYIDNPVGFTSHEEDLIRQGLANSATQSQYLSIAAQTTLPGERIVYASMRWSSQGRILHFMRQPTFSLRGLISGQDGSGFGYGSLEFGVSDSTTLYLYGGASFGEINSEFRRVLDSMGGLALRLSL